MRTNTVIISLVLLFALSVAQDSKCLTLEYNVAQNRHWPLRPVLQRDLLADLAKFDWPDPELAGTWATWQYDDSRERIKIIHRLTGDTQTYVGTFDGHLDFLLQIHPGDNRTITNGNWATIQCQSTIPSECLFYLNSIGHPNSAWPFGLDGIQIESIAGESEIDLRESSSIWQNRGAFQLHLVSTHITRTVIYMIYCQDSIEQSEEEASELIREREIWIPSQLYTHPFEVKPRTVGGDNVWCIEASAQDSICDICLSSSANRHTYYPITLPDTSIRHLIVQFSGGYHLLVEPPYDLRRSEEQVVGNETCTLVLDKALSSKIVYAISVFDNHTYTMHIDGLSRRAQDALANGGVYITSAPQLDTVRGLWMILLSLLLILRLTLHSSLLYTLYFIRRIDPYDTLDMEDADAALVSRSEVGIDAVLIVCLLVAGIWYAVALQTSLPPAPTYTAFYITVVVGAVAGVLNVVSIIANIASAYSGSFGLFGIDFAARCCFCCIMGSVKLKEHPRANIWVACIQKGTGNIVGLSAFLYALWWDTDDTYNWALVSGLLILLSIALIVHTVDVFALCGILRSISYALYGIVTLAVTLAVIITSVYDVWTPFFVTISGNAYSELTMQLLVWLQANVLISCVVLIRLRFINSIEAKLKEFDEGNKVAVKKGG